MIPLDSPRWSELVHAYGPATDTPALLRQLRGLPSSAGGAEPWQSLWSSLAHQGDIYPASFAAVPYVVAALALDPARADSSFFQFPAWVETCRRQQRIAVPADLEPAYTEAIGQLPRLVALASAREWDSGFLRCALAAIAAAKGHADVAEAVLELDDEVAREFLRWRYDEGDE